MSNPATPGCDSPVNEFAQQGGITNGAAWYSVPGGMQVWLVSLSKPSLSLYRELPTGFQLPGQ